MERPGLRFLEFYFFNLSTEKTSKHEFREINGDQANFGLLRCHNLSKDKLRNIIHWRHSTSRRHGAIVKFLSDVFRSTLSLWSNFCIIKMIDNWKYVFITLKSHLH